MLAKTPPLGWNSWNTFARNINEDVVLESAKAMVNRGFKDAGYEYVVIDDCWSLMERDSDKRLVADPAKFPHGMKWLADQIHALGLKFGMYSCCGTRTCANYPSSFDYEFIDAQTFADWGVDFLKYDNCNRPKGAHNTLMYQRMGLALKATGREILYSACQWGEDNPGEWIRSTGAHMYRSTGDIFDHFGSVREIAASQASKLCYAAPYFWNDIDMLVAGMHGQGNVGRGGMSDAEYEFHFALWCVMQSPLMMGCDIRTVDEKTADLMKHKELLAINQDPEGRQPYVIDRGRNYTDRYLGMKHMADGSYVLFAFNFSDGGYGGFTEFFDIGLSADCGYGLDLYDVMTGEKLGLIKDYVRWSLPPHGFRILRGNLVRRTPENPGKTYN
ncbi:MAG: glycoside hydrolase family 27 protein [Oscillospiraceae bacterium]|jgi:alpha-galactosidase|nr:glycoside hydrolase family 27 protein [Oscillospiraceae bacterium]